MTTFRRSLQFSNFLNDNYTVLTIFHNFQIAKPDNSITPEIFILNSLNKRSHTEKFWIKNLLFSVWACLPQNMNNILINFYNNLGIVLESRKMLETNLNQQSRKRINTLYKSRKLLGLSPDDVSPLSQLFVTHTNLEILPPNMSPNHSRVLPELLVENGKPGKSWTPPQRARVRPKSKDWRRSLRSGEGRNAKIRKKKAPMKSWLTIFMILIQNTTSGASQAMTKPWPSLTTPESPTPPTSSGNNSWTWSSTPKRKNFPKLCRNSKKTSKPWKF